MTSMDTRTIRAMALGALGGLILLGLPGLIQTISTLI